MVWKFALYMYIRRKLDSLIYKKDFVKEHYEEEAKKAEIKSKKLETLYLVKPFDFYCPECLFQTNDKFKICPKCNKSELLKLKK